MRRAAVALLALPLAACTGSRPTPAPAPEAAPPPAVSPVPVPTAAAEPRRETATLSGTIVYRQRSALTPEAVVQVELREAPPPGGEAVVVARRVIERPGQVPIAFSLSYDPAAIDPSRAYTVSARITDRGQLQFVTEAPIAVLTRGAPVSAEILVTPVR
ncbi:MAG: YbaY family lipoprotein [Syntrophomonadaceae bacterium]